MLPGGEPGGECMSADHRSEPHSGVIAGSGISGCMDTTTNSKRLALTSDELLSAGKRSGAVVV